MNRRDFLKAAGAGTVAPVVAASPMAMSAEQPQPQAATEADRTFWVGMMRRIADPTVYEHLKAIQPINIFVSISAIALGLGTIPFFINFFYSMYKGPKAPVNPWESNTLEWTLPSPVTLHGNFEKTPTVYHGPYEYSVPGMVGDHLPQNMPPTPGARIASH